MKKYFFSLMITLGIGVSIMNAQTYKTGAGVLVDFGDGTTWVGPHLKHFFSKNNAGEFSVLFGGNTTTVQAMYQYHQPISGAKGLQWYLGLGPAISFHHETSTFSVVPTAGLDFKIPGAPLDFSFDWRPRLFFYDGGSDFVGGRFGLGMRLTF